MSSQREFNEYINEKVQAISHLFGTRVIRNETINDDEYNYIRTYKKTITALTAELSEELYSSAEYNPLENNFNSQKKGNHGWGTKIISDIVNKYNGNMTMNYDNKIFKIKIMLIQEKTI